MSTFIETNLEYIRIKASDLTLKGGLRCLKKLFQLHY